MYCRRRTCGKYLETHQGGLNRKESQQHMVKTTNLLSLVMENMRRSLWMNVDSSAKRQVYPTVIAEVPFPLQLPS
ncbi:hypothetical protein CHARACLAT_021130 [Characodon lateralis]|uniref:Uncharacterized protein n=1 Tax=Characodon lateralis TaxID=208331 RepID=A0ABU7D8M8_9TELE|nr:hypothetical protein [Characodon lateralis]